MAGLAAVASGRPAPNVVTGTAPAGSPGRAVFVFPGQGSQWAGMGRDLAAASPVFAARLAECGAALSRYVEWDLDDVLAGELETADVVQPALWAVMVALAAAWQAAGVLPAAVAGHSQGEIAAATVAGILTLDDAARVVALRSRALRVLAGRGAMASVAEPTARVRDRLTAWDGRLSVAAVNGPAATVVSGDPDAVRELVAACEADGVRAKVLPVDYASHCAQVDQIRGDVLGALDGLTPAPAQIPMISTMTGRWLQGPEADAAYWYDSVRSPVEFEQAITALTAAGHQAFIEVSPHPVLTAAMAETAPAAFVTGTLRRDDGGPVRLLTALAAAHVRGWAANWAAVLPPGSRVDLPTYAFQRQRYWPSARAQAGTGRPATAGWRYTAGWVPTADHGTAMLDGTWLLLAPPAPASDLADWCDQALTARGAHVIRTRSAGLERAALAAQITAALAGTEDVRGVLSLLDLAGTLTLIQALADVRAAVPAWALTRGAVTTGPADVLTSPEQGQVWGLGRVAALEHPDLWGGLIDLPPAPDDRTAARLCAVLADRAEDQVAIRPGAIMARRLARAPQPGGVGARRWTRPAACSSPAARARSPLTWPAGSPAAVRPGSCWPAGQDRPPRARPAPPPRSPRLVPRPT